MFFMMKFITDIIFFLILVLVGLHVYQVFMKRLNYKTVAQTRHVNEFVSKPD